MLRDTLLCNLWMTEELVKFAKDNPEVVEWVKARVPPETCARLDGEVEEGQPQPRSLLMSEHSESD